MLFGAIEAGGTKFICAVGDEYGHIHEKIQIPTTNPNDTMGKVLEFFQPFSIQAIGVGSFGPVDIDKNSPTYGNITTTPKEGWKNYPLIQTLKAVYPVPIGFNTDVNAAALGEVTYGAAKGLDNCLYITIGTGIGAGAVVNGTLLQGYSHPEMGHTLVRKHPDDVYQGACPFHSDCLEGLASGPAIERRWGVKADKLEMEEKVWNLEGYYIAQALMQYILVLSPKKIILGGGVMHQNQVFTFIYSHLESLLNGYVPLPKLNQYIVSPGLGDQAGIIGALELAKIAFDKEGRHE